MADRPIIFSAPMVLALLNGRKTQTRRLAWQQRTVRVPGRPPIITTDRSPWQAIEPGDRLWVREGFAEVGSCDPGYLLYRASGYDNECARHGFDQPYPPQQAARWRPSIHMPRRVSRLTLTVTEQRAQKLHDITDADAEAEGVSPFLWVGRELEAPHRHNFQLLWDDLHGEGAWDNNPAVVALTFTVAAGNIDA